MAPSEQWVVFSSPVDLFLQPQPQLQFCDTNKRSIIFCMWPFFVCIR
jgi:hypothetical protein